MRRQPYSGPPMASAAGQAGLRARLARAAGTILDHSINKETGGDYAGAYCAKVWLRGQREQTTFVLGRNAGIFPDYDAALDWVKAQGAA